MSIKGKKILVGVSSSIAAYKAVEVCRRLLQQGAEVKVIMTRAATRLVTPHTFAAITQNPVYYRLFTSPANWQPARQGIEHISLARWAELLLIAPATANIIGKLAHGIADDLLSTLYLSYTGPVFLAPAMNEAMFNHPVVQENICALSRRGVTIISPGKGELACGEWGLGRLAEPETIVEQLSQYFSKQKSLAGQKVLITAGPTREHLDPVRFISNPSSGKMGLALASEAKNRAAKVLLITGPLSQPVPEDIRALQITTAQELYKTTLSNFRRYNILIFTAAVADFRAKQCSTKKLQKSLQPLTLELESTPDIAGEMGRRRQTGQILIGFAAQTHNHIREGKRKLIEKNLDLMIVNDVSGTEVGFSSDYIKASVIDKKGKVDHIGLLTKTSLAAIILDRISSMIKRRK